MYERSYKMMTRIALNLVCNYHKDTFITLVGLVRAFRSLVS